MDIIFRLSSSELILKNASQKLGKVMNKIKAIAIIVKDGTVNLKRSLLFDPIWDSFSVSYVAYIPQKYMCM